MLCTSGWVDHCSGVNAIVKPSINIKGPSRLAGRRHQATRPLRTYGTTIHPMRKARSAGCSNRLLARLRMRTPVRTPRTATASAHSIQERGTAAWSATRLLLSAGDVQIGPAADSSRVLSASAGKKTVLFSDLCTLSRSGGPTAEVGPTEATSLEREWTCSSCDVTGSLFFFVLASCWLGRDPVEQLLRPGALLAR